MLLKFVVKCYFQGWNFTQPWLQIFCKLENNKENCFISNSFCTVWKILWYQLGCVILFCFPNCSCWPNFSALLIFSQSVVNWIICILENGKEYSSQKVVGAILMDLIRPLIHWIIIYFQLNLKLMVLKNKSKLFHRSVAINGNKFITVLVVELNFFTSVFQSVWPNTI